MSIPTYEIYAIRYGQIGDRRSSQNFLGGDDHDISMPIDFFVWVLVGRDRTFVVDTGFDAAMGRKRDREWLRCPSEGLAAIGVNPGTVSDVILTHMHYDHAGNHALFPAARYHVQEREVMYCTGKCMCHPSLRYAYDADDVSALIRRLYDGRVTFCAGAEEKTPGLSVHHVGGHTMGLQVVRIFTRRGWMVLASDAAHYFANIDGNRPFPLVYNVAEMLDGYDTIRRLASSPRHIIPGHDPLVLKRYPAARPGLEGFVARLDADPVDA